MIYLPFLPFHNRLAKPFFGILVALSLTATQLHLDPKSTEVIVVGTVHEETKAYTSLGLLAILKTVHPDVILCEYDSSFFTIDFKFRRYFGGLEDSAICDYMKTEQVILRPYDIEGRNEFYRKHDVFNLQAKFSGHVSELAEKGKLNAESQEILKNIYECFKKRDAFGAENPRRINSFDCDRVLTEKSFVMDSGYSEIIRLTPELQGDNDFWVLFRSFELHRNNTMVKNIEKYAQEFQGKRILVVCGFEHRHFLRRHLKFSQALTFTVREYWEYPESLSQQSTAAR